MSLVLITAILFAGYVNTEPQSNTSVTEEAANSTSFAEGADDYGQLSGTDIQESTQNISGSQSSEDSIRVGAFNIQIFGKAKAANQEVMEVLADIVRNFDIIAIQEIRDSSGTALPSLISLVNSDNSDYSYVVSERIGRSSSKEQYAYVFNTDTIELTGAAHTYPEPQGTDPFHRQPYIVPFRTLEGNYDAVLMVIHTDPDEATEEINILDDVVSYARENYPEERDFIIMGDFNADGSYFEENSISDISGSDFFWVINNTQDTTVASGSNTYDRIVLTDNSDYISSGVFRFDTEYNLTYSMASAVSDHYPVYADLYIGRDNDEGSSNSSAVISIAELDLFEEWVKIHNAGSASVSLEGWMVTDESGNTYTFSSFTLAAESTVTLHTQGGKDNVTDLYWGSSRSIWNNDGDTASLYDAGGTLVDARFEM